MSSVHLLSEELTIMKTDHAGKRSHIYDFISSAHRQKTNQTNKKPWRNRGYFFQNIPKQTRKSLIITLRWFYSLMPKSLRSYWVFTLCKSWLWLFKERIPERCGNLKMECFQKMFAKHVLCKICGRSMSIYTFSLGFMHHIDLESVINSD